MIQEVQNLTFENRIWKFQIAGDHDRLIMGDQYLDEGERFAPRTIFKNGNKDLFVRIGDGNYVVDNGDSLQQFACYVLRHITSGRSYICLKDDFTEVFDEV